MTPERSKPRILMFLMLPLYGSGSGTYVRSLAQTLSQQGYEVAIAAPDKRKIPGVKIYHVEVPFMAVYGAHPELPGAPKYPDLSSPQFNELYQAFHRGFTAAVEDFNPDVIHAHHAFFPSWIGDFCRAIYRTHFLVTVHGTDVYNASLDHRYVVPTREALAQADYITVVSPQTRKWMFQVFGQTYRKRVRTILGGVNMKNFPNTGATRNVDKLYNLKGKPVVLFTGRLFATKGVEYLIKAAPKINAEIVIVGDGPEREKLEKLSKPNPRVHFTGYIDSKLIAEFYRRADVMVVPSVWDEPLGLISLEAMSSGTPVVASKKGGIGAAVKHGHNGFLVRARSATAIADATNRLLNDHELYARMAKNAREMIEQKFSWDVIAEQFERYYESVAHNTARRKQRKLPLTVTPEDAKRAKEALKLNPEHERISKR